MVAAVRLDCEAHTKDSCGLINGCPQGGGFFSLFDVTFLFAAKHHVCRIWRVMWLFLHLPPLPHCLQEMWIYTCVVKNTLKSERREQTNTPKR